MNAVIPGLLSSVAVPLRSVPKVRFRCEMPETPPEPLPKTPREYEAASRKLLWKSLKNLALFPIPPAIGYLMFDCSGLTQSISSLHPSLHQIIGHEGFGHAGLCFGLHYLVQSGKALWQAVTLPIPVKKTQPKVAPTDDSGHAGDSKNG
jgi:hypothetical protein